MVQGSRPAHGADARDQDLVCLQCTSVARRTASAAARRRPQRSQHRAGRRARRPTPCQRLGRHRRRPEPWRPPSPLRRRWLRPIKVRRSPSTGSTIGGPSGGPVTRRIAAGASTLGDELHLPPRRSAFPAPAIAGGQAGAMPIAPPEDGRRHMLSQCGAESSHDEPVLRLDQQAAVGERDARQHVGRRRSRAVMSFFAAARSWFLGNRRLMKPSCGSAGRDERRRLARQRFVAERNDGARDQCRAQRHADHRRANR